MIVIGKDRTQLLESLAQSKLEDYNSPDLRTLVGQLGIKRGTVDQMRKDILEVVNAELGDRLHIETKTPQLDKESTLKATVNKLFEALEQKDFHKLVIEISYGFYLALMEAKLAHISIKGYKTDLRNEVIRRANLVYPQMDFDRKTGVFKGDEELEIKLNHVLRSIRKAKTYEYQLALHNSKQKNQAEVNAKNSNQTVVDFTKVIPFLESVENLLDSGKTRKTDWKNIVTYLALITGRRTCELLSTYTEFTVIDEHNLVFKGQAKDKGYKESQPYPIYVLRNTSYVVKAMKWLLDNKKLTTPASESLDDLRKSRTLINNRTAGQLNKNLPEVAKAWEIDDDELTMHSLRKLYAGVLSALKPRLAPHQSELVFIGSMLGHGSVNEQGQFVSDIVTSHVYTTYHVINV